MLFFENAWLIPGAVAANTTGGSLIEALRRAEAAYDDLTEEERLLFVQGTPG